MDELSMSIDESSLGGLTTGPPILIYAIFDNSNQCVETYIWNINDFQARRLKYFLCSLV